MTGSGRRCRTGRRRRQKLTTKAKPKSPEANRPPSISPWPRASNWRPMKASRGGRSGERQPDDARLLEPVPAAALAEHIGEAESAAATAARQEPVDRAARCRCRSGVVCGEQQTGGSQRQRGDAEEDPRPRAAVDQPALHCRRNRRRGDNGAHGKQRLQDRLALARKGEKDQRLSGDEQDAARKALHGAQGDQQVEAVRAGGDASPAQRRRSSDEPARVEAVDSGAAA